MIVALRPSLMVMVPPMYLSQMRPLGKRVSDCHFCFLLFVLFLSGGDRLGWCGEIIDMVEALFCDVRC